MPVPVKWLLLLYGLPTKRGAVRVSLWRQLKKSGALPLKTSAYLLPDTPEHAERFQWLAQQVRDGGGEGTLIRATEIEGGRKISAAGVRRPRPHFEGVGTIGAKRRGIVGKRQRVFRCTL